MTEEEPPKEAFENNPNLAKKLRRWQTIVFITLFATYVSIYFCRANLTVSSTLFFDDDRGGDLIKNKAALGTMITVGTIGYAIGKGVSGWFVFRIGHKKTVILGLAGTAGFCYLFAFVKVYELLILFWTGNRFFQSVVWTAIIQFIAEWYHPKHHGKVTSVMCVSFLFGDTSARFALSGLIATGFGYQEIFVASASFAVFFFFLDIFVLKEAPSTVGLPDIVETQSNLNTDETDEDQGYIDEEASPVAFQHIQVSGENEGEGEGTTAVKGDEDQLPENTEDDAGGSNKEQLESKVSWKRYFLGTDQEIAASPLKGCLAMPAFYCICVCSVGVYFIREAFRDWSPLIFKEVSGLSEAEAGFFSSVYPIGGGVSTLLLGFISDRLPGRQRGIIMIVFQAIAVIGLALLSAASWGLTTGETGDVNYGFVVSMVTLVGAGMYGPFNGLIIACLDWCPKSDALHPNTIAMFLGLQSLAGYVGGALSGVVFGNLAETQGWGVALLVMTVVGAVSFVLLFWYYYLERERLKEQATKTLGDEEKPIMMAPSNTDGFFYTVGLSDNF